MNPETPNHALQRTAPRVTVAAPRRPTAQLPRHAPPSLSLGSLGDCGVFPSMNPFGVPLSDTTAVVTHTWISREDHWRAGRAHWRAGRSGWRAGQARWILFVHRPARFSPLFLHVSRESTQTPNQALERTGVSVTPPASAAAFPPATQASRPSRQSLSLGSLGVATRVL